MSSVLIEIYNSWVGQLFIILFGYGTIIVPGYFLIDYFKKSLYIDRSNSTLISKLIISCVYGNSYEKLPSNESNGSSSQKQQKDKISITSIGNLGFCFFGLQFSYLIWGVLQEKIMTREYTRSDGQVGKFNDSQFLVFVNRVLAFILSGVYILWTKQPSHSAPLYKYSYCSFSNIMSSWCQYEALKFVSFPTQVLAKASKIIPTMIMGKYVSAKTYEYYEYITAVLISIGMAFFLMSSTDDHGKNSPTSTTFSGLFLLIGYMTFDSFTSNWQGELFNVHKMSSVQMMCGVNLFSCLFTSISLLQQGAFSKSLEFMYLYPNFLSDCIILSLCSAFGQLFIYYTISAFGAVVFVIIMTIRQGLAILLSCLIYSHPVTIVGVFGIFIVFAAIFLRIYCSHRLKQIKSRTVTELTKA